MAKTGGTERLSIPDRLVGKLRKATVSLQSSVSRMALYQIVHRAVGNSLKHSYSPRMPWGNVEIYALVKTVPRLKNKEVLIT